MPQHKVAKAIKNLASLREPIKDDTALTSATSIITFGLAGDWDAVTADFERQFKGFQISHDGEVLKGAGEGTILAKGLLEHI